MADGTLLNPQQEEAVLADNGPVLIIAGAGTGKTTVIVEKIKHLILKKQIPPEKILALTFTEKAAAEMEERIDVAMPYGYSQLWIETFHAFCDRVLKLEGLNIGIDSGYKLISETEAVLFLRKNLFKFNLEYFRPLGNPTKFIQGLLQHISRLKDEDISVEEYEKWAESQKLGVTREEGLPTARTERSTDGRENERQAPVEIELEIKKNLELAHAYKIYEELKMKEGMLDFGDLISYTLKLFRSRKNVLLKYQELFDYILIDEFQDTNFAQNQLALLLTGKKKHITVVGDDDQAIYRWRGAAISNMVQFTSTFKHAKVITLTQNYRSTQTILSSAYALIQHNNPDRLEVKEKINKKLTPAIKSEEHQIDLAYVHNAEEEADYVIKQINQLVSKEKYSYSDFAILVRANDHATPFLRALERKKIPHQFLGPGKLFHQEEIKDLIAYLKILTNYEDSSSLYRVLCMNAFGIEPTAIATLLNTAKRRNTSLFYLLGHISDVTIADEEKEKLTKVYLLIKKRLALVSRESAGQILFFFLEETGILKKMVDLSDPQIEVKAKNIVKFFEKLKGFENEHSDTSVFSTIEWIDLSMQMGESPLAATVDFDKTEGVNILTVHSSKGLEFRVVFLVNLVKDRFPSRQRPEQVPIPQELIKEILPSGDYHLEEERRLFYVGMTRAKQRLIFTAAKFYGEGKRERKLSPFVYEALGETNVNAVAKKQEAQDLQLPLLDLFPHSKETTENQKIEVSQKSIVPVTYLSYSQIQTFDICPLHYKLRYILKIPTPATPATSFGISIHAALREFYQQQLLGNNLSFEDIEKIVKKTWNPEGYENAEHEKIALKKATELTKNFLHQDFDKKNLPIFLELPFEFFVNKMRIGGRIDRINKASETSIEIIDYKTGSNVPSDKDLKNNLQLTIYAMSAANSYNDILKKAAHVSLSLYFLEENKKLTTTRTPEQLDEAKTILLEKANEISQSDFSCSGSIFCKNCEYKMLCKAS